jgi:hypothetical protein
MISSQQGKVKNILIDLTPYPLSLKERGITGRGAGASLKRPIYIIHLTASPEWV